MLAVGFPAGFQESVVSTGLSAPTDMLFAPDGRLFVAEKSGRVRVIEDGVLLEDPFLEVAADPQGHHGLLSLVFDPNFENNGYIYVFYTVAEGDPAVRLSRFQVSNTDPNVADPNSETLMIDDIVMPIDIHDGGGMKFGTDGMLYVGIGDGGIAESAQDMTSLQGKLLRLDVTNFPNVIPADNPYVGVPGVREEIYAAGLRNPFKLDVDPVNDRIWITNTGDDSFEEINEAHPGANYGFPYYEGPSNDPDYDDPIYSYAHDTIGGAITAGTFYYGNAFPTEYNGDFFFADFSHQSIRRLDLSDPHAHDEGHEHEHEHEHELTSTDFAIGIPGPVDIEVGPDGALHYLDIWTGTVFRVDFVGGDNRAPEAVATSDVGFGDSPLEVTFDGSLSSDPDEDELTYSWDFGDGSSGEGATVVHTYATSGIYQARLTVMDTSGAFDVSDTITIAVDEHPPTAEIEVFPEHEFYRGGDTISFSGAGFDIEDGTLDPSALKWNVMFHHHTHTHPVFELDGVTAGSFVVPVVGETSPDVWYRITLTVTDSAGLTDSMFVDVYPHLTSIALDTNVDLSFITLDGATVSSPTVFDGVAGVMRSIEAPLLQQKGGKTYLFDSWSDGGFLEHTIQTPLAATTYTANYVLVAPDRVAASYYVAGLYEQLLGRVAEPDGLVYHVDQLMAGESPNVLIESLWNSPEHRALQVYETYSEFFDRIPAPDETAYWVDQLSSGVTEIQFARTLLTSSEFITLNRNIPFHYIDDLYKLVLKRTGTPEEIQYWVNLLNNGVAHYDIAQAFLTTGERFNVLLNRYFNAFLDRPIEPSEAVGDLFAQTSASVQLVGTKVLGSSEFLTKQAARPVIVALYDNVLHRAAADGEIEDWVNQLRTGLPREVVASAFQQSPEGLSHFVKGAYAMILDRSASDLEVSYWVGQMTGGMSEQDVQQAFYASGEFQALHPEDGDFVESLYLRILGREVEASELSSWVDAIQSGVPRATVVSSLFATDEYRSHVIAGVYAEFLGREPVANETEFWTNNLPFDGTMAAVMRTSVLSSDEYYRTAEVHTLFAHELQNESFVAALYDDILQRAASQFEIGIWTDVLDAGASRTTVAGYIWDSVEHATLVANQLYADFLERAPTSQEVDDIITLVGSSGQSVAAYSLLTTVEYSTLYSSNTSFVEALYKGVLNRTASPFEVQFWTDDLDGGLSRSAAAAVFLNSVEARNNLVDATYNNYLGEDPADEVVDTWLALFETGQTERDLALSILGGEDYYDQQSQ